MSRIALFFLLTLAFANSFAQTFVGGTIAQSTSWAASGNPFVVQSNIFIPDSVVLTILPGVEVIFDSLTGMEVEGQLIARGTITDSIYFVGENGTLADSVPYGPRVWNGISLRGAALNFDYVHGSMSYGFIHYYSNNTPILYSEIEINHSTITENRLGIEMSGGMRQSAILNSAVTYCAEGIAVDSCVVRDCRFANNYTAGIFTLSSVGRNEFVNNQGTAAIINGVDLELNHFEGNETAIGLNYYGKVKTNQDTSWIFFNELRDNLFGISIRDIPYTMVKTGNNVICSDSLNLIFENVPLIDVTNNCWCTTDRIELVQKTVWLNTTAPFSPYIHQPVLVDCIPDEVYPGDANHDGVANAWDVLPIGVHYGQTGIARPLASLNWIGQPAPDWGTVQGSGFDIKHVDCNGDATIDHQDTLAIQLNYGLTHRSRRGTSSNNGIPLILQAPAGLVSPGDTVHYDILLGNMDTTASGIYGLAFSANYDTAQVKLAATRVLFAPSWLGTEGQDLLGFYHNDTLDGRVDVAIVRTDGMSRSGYGKIGELIIVIDDDIAKKEIEVNLTMGPANGIDPQAGDIPLSASANEVSVSTKGEILIDLKKLQVYPNPTQNLLHVRWKETPFRQVRLMDLQGRILLNQSLDLSSHTVLDLGNYPSGLYLLHLDGDNGSIIRKVMKR